MVQVIKAESTTYFGGVAVTVTGLQKKFIYLHVPFMIHMRDKRTSEEFFTSYQGNYALTREELLAEHYKKYPRARIHRGRILEVTKVIRDGEELSDNWTYEDDIDRVEWLQFPNNTFGGEPDWIRKGFGDSFVRQMEMHGYVLQGQYFKQRSVGA